MTCPRHTLDDSLTECAQCGKIYCHECAEHEGWNDFCSENCKYEFEEANGKGFDMRQLV